MRYQLKDFAFRVLFIALCAATYWSCTEEIEPYSYEPAVKLRFFNMDSLASVNSSISEVDTLIKYLNIDNTALTSRLRTLNDSLINLNALIEGGREDLNEARESVETEIATSTVQQSELRTSLESLAAEKGRLAKIVTVINSGKALLKKIEVNGNSIAFEDSATTFRLPLNMNATSQVYYLELGNRRDSLEITYTVSEVLTERSYIKLVANDIQRSTNHSFDSVTVYCQSLPDPCPSNETTLNVYF